MNLDLIRYFAAAGIIWFALQGNAPSISPAAPYNGLMRDVHTATRSMDAHDRQGLSEALTSASKMLAEDRAGLIKTTEDLQEFVKGSLAYGYSSFSIGKYPAAALAVQSELERAVGASIQAVTPEIRSKVAETLSEAGRAVR